jgi:hypothetical protein
MAYGSKDKKSFKVKKNKRQIVAELPVGGKCCVIGCEETASNRGAFLCKTHGLELRSYLATKPPDEREQAKIHWIYERTNRAD